MNTNTDQKRNRLSQLQALSIYDALRARAVDNKIDRTAYDLAKIFNIELGLEAELTTDTIRRKAADLGIELKLSNKSPTNGRYNELEMRVAALEELLDKWTSPSSDIELDI